MSSQNTGHPTIADQQAAIAALFTLAWAAPHLPAPYIHITSSTGGIHLNVQDPAEFEAWRAVLRIDPCTVVLKGHSKAAWLKAETQFNGASVEICTGGVPLGEVQANTPQAIEPAASVLA